MRRFVEDIKKYKNYIVYSSKSQLKSEIANSHLSWLWWILDPLLFMLVYSFIALVVFGKGEKYFPIFVFIGLNCWQFFFFFLKQSVKLVNANKQIVSKVYIPKYILILIKMGFNGFKMVVSFSLVVLLMIVWRVPVSLNILYIIPVFAVLIVVTFGFSTFMLHFGVFVEDLSNVITVVLKLVFYMTGIFYSITSRVPEPYSSLLLKFNPVALVVEDLRRCMIYDSVPHRAALLAWFLIGSVLSVLGIKIIYKYENSYVKVM